MCLFEQPTLILAFSHDSKCRPTIPCSIVYINIWKIDIYNLFSLLNVNQLNRRPLQTAPSKERICSV